MIFLSVFNQLDFSIKKKKIVCFYYLPKFDNEILNAISFCSSPALKWSETIHQPRNQSSSIFFSPILSSNCSSNLSLGQFSALCSGIESILHSNFITEPSLRCCDLQDLINASVLNHFGFRRLKTKPVSC